MHPHATTWTYMQLHANTLTYIHLHAPIGTYMQPTSTYMHLICYLFRCGYIEAYTQWPVLTIATLPLLGLTSLRLNSMNSVGPFFALYYKDI